MWQLQCGCMKCLRSTGGFQSGCRESYMRQSDNLATCSMSGCQPTCLAEGKLAATSSQRRLQICKGYQDSFLCPNCAAALIWTGVDPVIEQPRCLGFLACWHELFKTLRPSHSNARMAEILQLQITGRLDGASFGGPYLEVVAILRAAPHHPSSYRPWDHGPSPASSIVRACWMSCAT